MSSLPRSGWYLGWIVLLGLGCATRPDSDGDSTEGIEASAPVESTAPDDVDPPEEPEPGILERPFTAAQIRDEWRAGFSLKLRRETVDGTEWERWTVIDADETGASIEFASLDASGKVQGEPAVQRSLWNELRDHATFSADVATRDSESRETPLGKLDCWVYRVRDDEAGTVTEYAFAKTLPGAPVELRVTRGGRTIMSMTQVERARR